MKRIILFAGLLFLGGIPSFVPASQNCVADQGCPSGMQPPKCCKPPPCEFLDALQRAKAMKRIYREQLAISEFYEESGEEELAPLLPVKLESDYEKFKEKANKAMDKARKKFPKCRKRSPYPDPPILSVTPDDQCRIKAYVGGEFAELSYDQVQAASNSCAEFIDAKWDAALNRQSDCNLTASDPSDEKGRANRRGYELEAEYQSLLESLQQYWSRCSIKPGSKLAREMAARGISELKFNPPDPPKKKGPSKKSGKRGEVSI